MTDPHKQMGRVLAKARAENDRINLDALIAAVEAGTLPEAVFHGSSSIRGHWAYATGLDDEQRRKVYLAYHGSLDAAKALHDALLPGWSVHVQYAPFGMKPHQWFFRLSTDHTGWGNGKHAAANHDKAARAWLLAILKAYRAAMEEPQ